MHLYIKQKVLTLRDRFQVYDDDEQAKYNVEGKFISIGKKLRILKGEQEIARIEQEVLHLFGHFNIHIEGKGDYKVIRKFSFLKPKYTFEGIDWSIEGDWFEHDYRIISGAGEEIADISKHWISIGDTYDINIYKDKYELLALCTVLAIDADTVSNTDGTIELGAT